ncbi:MAG: D-alanyl-D-alanine carboxypeptidase [Bacilli bacterium]|nr:D-alanyl-D-alanine carboxypeptidase [Bacilli bacterium]MDD4375571.1 D-alanyl-D-alanine carboxypeptidase [Clostridia bacterium]
MKLIKFLLVMFLLLPNSVKAMNFAERSKSAILLEASTGEVVFEKNPHERFAPASMTKMMSMLLVVENIERNVISWDDIVTVSPNASGMGGSQILLETNEKMSVRDLFKGVAIASGNDAIVALAEKIAGSEDMFVKMMNDRSRELGLKNTNFKNSHGLDEANHYSSAYDMAIIARELVNYPEVLEYTKIYDTYLRENLPTKVWLVNTNNVVP